MSGKLQSRNSDSDRIYAYSMFAALWAASALFHIGSFSDWRISAPVTLAAVLLLARPSSLSPLLVLAALQISDAALNAQDIVNHYLIAAIVNLSVIGSYLMSVSES